ncbi:MAG: Antitoxin ParD [Pseudomonadota bacterium]|jgi:hypothetical protein
MVEKTVKTSKKMVRLTIELPFETRQKLKSQAALDGTNMKEALIKIINAYGGKKIKLDEI